ncbi:hypothetical protein VPH35_060635 [Triticum aestivum]
MPAGAPIHVFKNLQCAAIATPQSRWSPRRTTERRHGHAMKIDALVAGVGVLIFSSKRRFSGMGALFLKGQGCIVCTHIKEKLGMFLCLDLVRKYYIMQYPSKWRHLMSSTRRGGVSMGSPRNNKTFELVADDLSIL